MASMVLEQPDRFRIGRIFGASFAVIGRNPLLCLGLALLFSGLPSLVFDLRMQAPETDIAVGDPEDAIIGLGMVSRDSVITSEFLLMSFVLDLLLQSSLVRATIEDPNGKQPSIGDCIKIAIGCFLPTLGIGLLVVLGAGLGLILLVIPGIILWLCWLVAVPVLVQERLGVLGSMARSSKLTKGSRWALFGLFLILIATTVAIQLALERVVEPFGGLVGAFVGTLVWTTSSMVMSIATAVSYVELRQVREGTSVDELAEIFS
ncbi:MAG: hypothetical protein E5X83_22040 [Mesorhizobium sp.]|nr:MAG: hypothetical protein EOR82_22415 [Mesorhizobium sp.]TIO23086.1 MAG: hypothetical protein E5X83_22040 [Mesorhizobium sp.]TJV56516.1 MAG: hypothetical protein E5X82_23180 [Mesorhizobium sp.]